MAGTMIPFATLYVYGLNRLLPARSALVLGTIVAITLAISTSEFLANRVAFSSAYNWFHM